MPEPTTFEIVIRGRASAGLLRPLLDDFTVEHTDGTTLLRGEVRDAAHLHGVVAHLTSVNVELISIVPACRAVECTAVTDTHLNDHPNDHLNDNRSTHP